jgi:hypothetical protein
VRYIYKHARSNFIFRYYALDLTWKFWANAIQGKPLEDQEAAILAGPEDLTGLFSATPLETAQQLDEIARGASRAADEASVVIEQFDLLDERLEGEINRKRAADVEFDRELAQIKREIQMVEVLLHISVAISPLLFRR